VQLSTTGQSRQADSGSGAAQTWQPVARRARGWFGSRPTWAKIVLVLVAVALLPWLLIAAGLGITGIGTVGLLRGSLPRFQLANRPTAAMAVLVGLIGIAAGSGLASAVLGSGSPASNDSQIAAPTTSAAPTITATTPPPPPTTSPSPAPPTATVKPTTRTTTPPPRPSTRPPTTKPAPPLTVAIVSLPPTGQGSYATATVQTAPAASCSIQVEYKSGPATAAGLDPKTASASGAVQWTWKVGTRTTPGSWPVTVTCTRRSASESDQRFLTVLDTGNPG
jgi:hypothetical protein